MPAPGLQEIGTTGLAVYVLVEICKQAGFPSRYGGLLSIGLGLFIGGVSSVALGTPWLPGLINGFWGAASASGVYAGVKSTFNPSAPTPPATTSVNDDPALHPSC